MNKFIDLIFNFNTKKKINLERDIFWGLTVFFTILVLMQFITG